MEFHWIDLVCIAAYFILILGIGVWNINTAKTDESFLYASRKLTLPSFVMSLVATWYGLILGVGEMVYYYGVMAWVVNGLLWYGIYIAYAQFFAEKIHESDTPTVSSLFTKYYGKTIGMIAGGITAIMSSPAAYILSLAVVVQFFFNSYGIQIDSLWLVIGISLFTAFYIFFQGFTAVIRTDILQFILLFLGFGSLLIYSIISFGGFDFLIHNTNIPAETHFSVPGSMGWQMMFVWGMLALWTFVDPNFYHRCFASQSGKNAKKGIYWAILFWFLFDMLTLATGLYALGAFPLADPAMGYLALANEVLPMGLKGIFLVAIVAVIMSTIDSFTFTSATILAKDFFSKCGNTLSLKTLTRIGILITLIISLALIVFIESIIGIVYALGTVGVALLLPPLLFILFCKTVPSVYITSISLGLSFSVLLVWILYGWMNLDDYGFPQYFYGIEPMYPGIIVNTLVLLLGLLFQNIHRYSKK